MNSREQILQSIRERKPAPVLKPGLPDIFGHIETSLVDRFKDEIKRAGGSVVPISRRDDLAGELQKQFQPARSWSSLPGLTLPGDIGAEDLSVSTLEQLELVVLEGELGVAENGAIWIPGKLLTRRVLPFITLDLAILLSADRLVENLHAAYEQIEVCQSGFGLFLSGPSKTADIEQSLVMGAHGPRSTTVYLLESE